MCRIRTEITNAGRKNGKYVNSCIMKEAGIEGMKKSLIKALGLEMALAGLCLLLVFPWAKGEEGETYISERISNNYTRVSAAYTLPPYGGEDVVCLMDGAVSDLGEAQWAEDNHAYPGGGRVLKLKYGDTVTLRASVPQDGLYTLAFDYLSWDESVLPIKFSLAVDGEFPFYECRSLKFETTWLRNTEPAYDRYGDEMIAIPRKLIQWESKYVSDATYRRSEPLLLEMKAGEHLLTLTVKEGSFLLGGAVFGSSRAVPQDAPFREAAGDVLLTLQGEAFFSSNDSSIHAVMEYDTAVEPYEVAHTRLNTIDSDSFKTAGQSLTYVFTVEKAGYYDLALHYRQSDKTDFPVFVDVMVDGETPSASFAAYPLPYAAAYQTRTLQDQAGQPLSVYLESGEHTLTFRLSIAPIRPVMEALDEIMYGINDLALEITKVAGTNADKYRDLKLSRYIPDLEEKLRGYADQLTALEKQYIPYSNSDTNVAVMASMVIAARQLTSLAENPDEIPYRIGELSSSSNSANQYLANTIDHLLNNNLAIDRIYVYQQNASLPTEPGFFSSLGMNARRFSSSFTKQTYSASHTDREHLQVWVNRSNQYVQIMQKLIDERFTPETGIQVDLSIMPDQYKLVLSNSSGSAPDVATGINYTIPYELAIRGALADLTQFEGFRETAAAYEPGFFLTGTIGEGIYSMPETMNFWVLFCRTDVMDKLGLEVPETMTDVINMLPELQMRGLNFYYATAGMTAMRNFHGTTPLLVQHGGALYYDTAEKGTALGSRESITGFTALTDLFTIYNMPVNVDNFYQHFRNGDMPIGIADFYTYNLIKNAAPELDGSWSISLIPGTEQPDGSLSRTTCGCAESTVIFKSTAERERQAWDFIRWWSQADTQAEFGQMVQIIYGDEYIWPTANLEAFSRLPWETEDKLVVLSFARNVVDVARVPGTYLLEREMSNAFNDITVNGKNEQTRIDKAVKTINRELRRKLEEFGYIDADGKVLREYPIPTVETVKKLLGR